MPEMVPVYSSGVDAIGYDAVTQELWVRWSRGREGKEVSVYVGVPPEIGENLHRHPSIGEALRPIKERYPHRYAE